MKKVCVLSQREVMYGQYSDLILLKSQSSHQTETLKLSIKAHSHNDSNREKLISNWVIICLNLLLLEV